MTFVTENSGQDLRNHECSEEEDWNQCGLAVVLGGRTGLTVKSLGILAQGYGYRHPVYHNWYVLVLAGIRYQWAIQTLVYMYISTKRHDTLHAATRSRRRCPSARSTPARPCQSYSSCPLVSMPPYAQLTHLKMSSNNSLTLPALLSRTLTSLLPIFDDTLSTSLPQAQTLLRTALADLALARRMIDALGIFSDNESMEDVGDGEMVYMCVDWVVGEVQGRVNGEGLKERIQILERSQVGVFRS